MSHSGRNAPQMMSVAYVPPPKADVFPPKREYLFTASESALIYAYRNGTGPPTCPCQGRLPWEDWTPQQWAEYERRQLDSMAETQAQTESW